MKHKCVINGCSQKGIYNLGYDVGTYCKAHADVLATRHGWRYSWEYDEATGSRQMAWQFSGLGGTHEGRKIGKPRSWRFERNQKAAPEYSATEEAGDA